MGDRLVSEARPIDFPLPISDFLSQRVVPLPMKASDIKRGFVVAHNNQTWVVKNVERSAGSVNMAR